jgi:hypothetical protein
VMVCAYQWYQVEIYSTTKSKPSEIKCKNDLEIHIEGHEELYSNVQHVGIAGTSRISLHSRSDFLNLQRCGTVLCLCTHAIEIFREGQK